MKLSAAILFKNNCNRLLCFLCNWPKVKKTKDQILKLILLLQQKGTYLMQLATAITQVVPVLL